MNGPPFVDILSELDNTSSELELIISENPPYFKISTNSSIVSNLFNVCYLLIEYIFLGRVSCRNFETFRSSSNLSVQKRKQISICIHLHQANTESYEPCE